MAAQIMRSAGWNGSLSIIGRRHHTNSGGAREPGPGLAIRQSPGTSGAAACRSTIRPYTTGGMAGEHSVARGLLPGAVAKLVQSPANAGRSAPPRRGADRPLGRVAPEERFLDECAPRVSNDHLAAPKAGAAGVAAGRDQSPGRAGTSGFHQVSHRQRHRRGPSRTAAQSTVRSGGGVIGAGNDLVPADASVECRGTTSHLAAARQDATSGSAVADRIF